MQAGCFLKVMLFSMEVCVILDPCLELGPCHSALYEFLSLYLGAVRLL